MKIGQISKFQFFSWLAVWLVCVGEIWNQIVNQITMSWLVTMQNFNLIAPSVLKFVKMTNCDNDGDDTHQG